MSDDLTWIFDLAVIEWLIVLAALVLLSIMGAFVSSQSLKTFRSLKDQADTPTSTLDNWHTETIVAIFKSLETTENGLSNQEASNRLKKYGPNQLPKIKVRGPLMRFFYQFHNVLIYVLISASAITAMLGHWTDASVILAVVFINAITGFVQEGKAEDALKAIQQMLSPNAMVIRDGQQLTIQAKKLVPGDIVLFQSGDKVPADIRLFRVKGLQIQESVLTGESVAVDKLTEAVQLETMLGDRFCMAYSGTLVSHGQGAGVVVRTGAKTELGRISILVSEVKSIATPLLNQMAQFSRWLTLAILIIAGITFSFGTLLRDYVMAEMFLAAVSLAVAAIPEGLPAIMTITLAIGVQRMAKRNAIIRRLPAVETLGAVSVICTDKTGTLTRNEMTVRTIVSSDSLFELSGTGYDPHGSIMQMEGEKLADDSAILTELLRAAVLCNDASLQQKNDD